MTFGCSICNFFFKLNFAKFLLGKRLITYIFKTKLKIWNHLAPKLKFGKNMDIVTCSVMTYIVVRV
jgi:hypothetical protein